MVVVAVLAIQSFMFTIPGFVISVVLLQALAFMVTSPLLSFVAESARMDEPATLVLARAYPARFHADLACSALEARGIPAKVVAMAGYTGLLPFQLWVMAEDLASAILVLGPDERFS